MRYGLIMGLMALLPALTLARARGPEPVFPKDRKYTVGVAAGMVGGSGLSLERWFGPDDGLRLTCAPYYNEEKYPEPDGDTYYPERISGSAYDGFLSLGGLWLHSIGHFHRFTLLGFGGGNYLGTFEKKDYVTEYSSYPYEDRVVRSYEETSVLSLGGGVGGRVNFWRIDLSMLIGMSGAYDFTHDLKRFTPSVDVGAHFHL